MTRPSRSHSSAASLTQCVSMSASTRVGEVLHRGRLQVGALEDLVAARVDDLALLVHHLVVLQHVLADLGVALLDRGLRPLDGLGDHLRLDGLVVGQGPAHHPAERAGGEQAHQLVVEAEVEAALAGVALAAAAATQLVVDAAALVALGAQHVQAAECADLVALGRALRLEARRAVRRSGRTPSARASWNSSGIWSSGTGRAKSSTMHLGARGPPSAPRDGRGPRGCRRAGCRRHDRPCWWPR